MQILRKVRILRSRYNTWICNGNQAPTLPVHVNQWHAQFILKTYLSYKSIVLLLLTWGRKAPCREQEALVDVDIVSRYISMFQHQMDKFKVIIRRDTDNIK